MYSHSHRLSLFSAVLLVTLSLFWHTEIHPAAARDAVSLKARKGLAQQVHTATPSPTILPPTLAWTLTPSASPIPATSPTPTLTPTDVFSTAFAEFVERVSDGQTGVIRGVDVEGVLTLPVIQQPAGDGTFVSANDDTITQFQNAARNGVIGLLAHNYLSGERFFNLAIGQEVRLVYGDGRVTRYQITDIQRFQKLEPNNNQSRYIDLATQANISTPQLFGRMYTGGHRVVFQTCIEKDGEWSWGLIFVTATPLN